MIWTNHLFEGSNKTGVLFFSLFLMTIIIINCPVVHAGEEGPDPVYEEKDWYFFASVHGWFPGIEGNVVSAGQGQDINVPFSDIISNTDSGFMFAAEVRKRKWFARFDGIWARLAAEERGDIVDLDISLDQKIYDFSIGREIFGRALDESPSQVEPAWRQNMRLDLFVGARYFETKPTVDITTFLGDKSQIRLEEKRWDPFIGLRFLSSLSKRWMINLSGDIGGFGIGDAAEFAWQLEGDVGYRFNERFTIFAGYRALSFDTVQGHGDERSGVDLLQHGPMVGLGVIF